MFEIELSERRVAVRAKDGRQASLEIGRASITAMCEGKKVTSSRARMRDAVAQLLALLRPKHAGLIERMIAEDHLVPDAPLTFEFLRLFRQLRGALERWQDELEPEVVVAQRRSLEILGQVHPILMNPNFLDETMVLRDMLRWRAAVLALNLAESFVDPIPAMRNWRGLFSPTGKPYRSLNRTLMQLPEGVEDMLLVEVLHHVKLERAMTDAVELSLYLWVAREFHQEGISSDKAQVLRTVAHAPREEILASLRSSLPADDRMGLSGGGYAHLARVLSWAPDGPARLPSLVHRGVLALTAHRYEHFIELLGGWDARTLPPPDNLPSRPKVQEICFLSTIREVHEEGQLMNHCVADLIQDALSGRIYLFHVEFRGEQATVAMDSDGELEHVNGPFNQSNGACEWARDAFDAWQRGDEVVGTPRAIEGQTAFEFG